MNEERREPVGGLNPVVATVILVAVALTVAVAVAAYICFLAGGFRG